MVTPRSAIVVGALYAAASRLYRRTGLFTIRNPLHLGNNPAGAPAKRPFIGSGDALLRTPQMDMRWNMNGDNQVPGCSAETRLYQIIEDGAQVYHWVAARSLTEALVLLLQTTTVEADASLTVARVDDHSGTFYDEDGHRKVTFAEALKSGPGYIAGSEY